MAKTKKTVKAKTDILISAPKEKTAMFTIVGSAPYVQNKFSKKAREQMRITQEAGPTGKKGKAREAKDFKACYEGAKHISEDGWCGMPCSGFRAALISACKMVGFAMTRAKLSLFIEPDGFDVTDSTPLVKITKGKPEYSEMPVRNETGVCDIRPRPLWRPGWEAKLRVRYDEDQFTLDDVANLLLRVGRQVGIGEGRPDSRKSCGMGWGLFDIKSK